MCVSKYSVSSFFMNLIYICLVSLCFLFYSVRINRFLYLCLACGSYPCLNPIVIKKKVYSFILQHFHSTPTGLCFCSWFHIQE